MSVPNRQASSVTTLLRELSDGNSDAENKVMPLIYDELRRIARAQFRHENPGHSLQPTALVHEAYLRLARVRSIQWQSRTHFYAVAATMMRRILVDHARTQLAEKRGAGFRTVTLDEAMIFAPQQAMDVLALDEALERLAKLDPRQARIVELRFFAGMTETETGEALDISARTVKRDWRVAKAWLFREISSA